MHTRTSHHSLPTLSRVLVVIITLFVLVSLTVSTALAYDTGAFSPSRAATPGKSWKNISYSFASDNQYATASRTNKQLRLYNFTLPGIPGGATINGIEVTVEGFTSGLQANVSLSFNGGSSYTSAQTTALTGVEAVNTLGGPSNTWGRTWNPSEFTNTNFMMKLVTTGASGNGITISVDQVQVKVYYTPPPTTLTLAPVSGPYAGTANMTATLTLTADSSPIPSKTINFYVGGTGINNSGGCTGTFVGSASTQGTGVATLANASLAGVNTGDNPYGACASFAGDANYQGTSISSDLNVVGTATTLVAAPATGDYGGTASLSATLTMASNGSPINNEFITFYLFGNSVGTAKTNNSGVATLGNVNLLGYDAGSSYDIGASFDGDSNLNPATAANALITINQRLITVTAVSDSKVYDGTVSSSGVPTYSAGALITGDTATFTQTFDTKHVGTGKTLTPGGVVDDGNLGQNYTYTFVPVTTGAISKTLLTVTADNKSMFIGGSDPAYTFHYGSMAAGDTSADIDVAPACGVSSPHSLAGTYPIICSGGSDNDYNFSFVNGTLTVAYAHFNVDINGANKGGYDLAVGSATRQAYASVDGGPAKVYSTNGASLLASQRFIYTYLNSKSYSEMMGYPGDQLTTDYWFTWYNNISYSTQLRVSNMGSNSAEVKVYAGTTLIDTLNLAAGEGARKSYNGLDSGPLHVVSTDGVTPILASERFIQTYQSSASYAEMMGYPGNQLATQYWFPWYNNLSYSTQLRVSNLGNNSAEIKVYAGSSNIAIDTFTLGAGQGARKAYSIDNGPLHVVSTDGVTPILASERFIQTFGSSASYAEMMGYPSDQLFTEYCFPWYNNTSDGGVTLSSQLRVSNMGGISAQVKVFLAGSQIDSFTLLAGEGARKSYTGLNSGPLCIKSTDGVTPILASERFISTYLNSASYSEIMANPTNKLATTYWFPWYNNISYSTEFRFGKP